MHKLPSIWLTAGMLGLAAGQASATLSPDDQEFARKAASIGIAEVQTAQLAQQKAASPQIKQFASRMVADHAKANDALQQIGRQANVTLPSQPDQKEMATEQKLRGLNGPSFDQAYAEEELRDHQEDVACSRRRRCRARIRLGKVSHRRLCRFSSSICKWLGP